MNRTAKLRSRAFQLQGGLCFYCAQPMWQIDGVAFAKEHYLTLRQAASFRCTLEHLLPHAAGGTLAAANVAAACLYCNRRRGEKRLTPSPQKFRLHVLRRCKLGKWHAAFPASTPNNASWPGQGFTLREALSRTTERRGLTQALAHSLS